MDGTAQSLYNELMINEHIDEDDISESEYMGCECEIDWNCPLHAHRVGTWIETRYDHLDDGERY